MVIESFRFLAFDPLETLLFLVSHSPIGIMILSFIRLSTLSCTPLSNFAFLTWFKRFSNAKNLFKAEPLIALPSTRKGYSSSGSRESLTLNLFFPLVLEIDSTLS